MRHRVQRPRILGMDTPPRALFAGVRILGGSHLARSAVGHRHNDADHTVVSHHLRLIERQEAHRARALNRYNLIACGFVLVRPYREHGIATLEGEARARLPRRAVGHAFLTVQRVGRRAVGHAEQVEGGELVTLAVGENAWRIDLFLQLEISNPCASGRIVLCIRATPHEPRGIAENRPKKANYSRFIDSPLGNGDMDCFHAPAKKALCLWGSLGARGRG